jgi:hypothetical protein
MQTRAFAYSKATGVDIASSHLPTNQAKRYIQDMARHCVIMQALLTGVVQVSWPTGLRGRGPLGPMDWRSAELDAGSQDAAFEAGRHPAAYPIGCR